MALDFNTNSYLHGINGFGLINCPIKYSVTLSATTDTSVTVPAVSSMGSPGYAVNRAINPVSPISEANSTNNLIAIIMTDNPSVFMAVNGTAAVPAGDSFAATNSSLVSYGQPYARYVPGGSVLHFITAAMAANVTIEFYAAPF